MSRIKKALKGDRKLASSSATSIDAAGTVAPKSTSPAVRPRRLLSSLRAAAISASTRRARMTMSSPAGVGATVGRTLELDAELPLESSSTSSQGR